MASSFSIEYAERSDDELLQLASDRASLTDEAAAALDTELGRRSLTRSDQLRREQFVKRSERRESRRLRRKVFGTRGEIASWFDNVVFLFCYLFVVLLIEAAYQALPSKYHFTSDWQEAAEYVMFASVFIAVASSVWWRKIGFWVSLLISSTIHSLLVHAWILRAGTLGGVSRRGYGGLAVLLGIVLFFLVYGGGWLLRRKFYGEAAAEE